MRNIKKIVTLALIAILLVGCGTESTKNDFKSKETSLETKIETISKEVSKDNNSKKEVSADKEDSKKETKKEEVKKEVQPKETKKEEPKKEVQPKETKKEEVKKEVQPKETKKDIKKNKVEEQPKIKKEELKQPEIKKEPKPITKPELKPTPKPQPKPEPKPITYPANSITVGDSTITWVYWKNVVGYTNWNKDDVGPATSLQNAIDKERDKWVNIMTENNLFSINGTKNLWIASHNYNTPGKQVYHIPQSIIVTDQYGVSAKYKLIDRAKTYDFIGTGTYGKNDVFVQTCLPDGKDVMHFTLVEILK